ncbi:MAG: hypothetical protein AB200_01870 [Parcubacteria bacterium C7867-005]|nr:MAG: hypothetical protein AB200_01870 [Parcubacteria bacterium C7867-005]
MKYFDKAFFKFFLSFIFILILSLAAIYHIRANY